MGCVDLCDSISTFVEFLKNGLQPTEALRSRYAGIPMPRSTIVVNISVIVCLRFAAVSRLRDKTGIVWWACIISVPGTDMCVMGKQRHVCTTGSQLSLAFGKADDNCTVNYPPW